MTLRGVKSSLQYGVKSSLQFTLNDHCKKLVAGQSVMHQGQQFDCVVEYLEHWKDNVNHDMLPIKKMDQVIEQVERIREQDHHLEL